MTNQFENLPGHIPWWGLDFPRAVANRPWWARLLFWLVLGESGRHEFWGLIWAIQRCGLDAFFPECEWRSGMSKMPLFWRDKRVYNPKDEENDKHRS